MNGKFTEDQLRVVTHTGTRATVHCAECGNLDHLSFGGEVGQVMEQRGLCFSCAYWSLVNPRDPRSVRVDGVHYCIGDEDARGMRGFGGSLFRIRWLADGKVTESTNLWMAGEIPERWRDRLPDNAEFLREEVAE